MKCFLALKGFSNFNNDSKFIGVIKEEGNISRNIRPLITKYLVENPDYCLDESVDFDNLSDDDFWVYVNKKFDIFVEEKEIID